MGPGCSFHLSFSLTNSYIKVRMTLWMSLTAISIYSRAQGGGIHIVPFPYSFQSSQSCWLVWSFITLTGGAWPLSSAVVPHLKKWVKLVHYALKEWVSKISLLQRILPRVLCVHSQYPLSSYQRCHLIRTASSVTWQSVSKTVFTNVGGKANHKHYIGYFSLYLFWHLYFAKVLCGQSLRMLFE